MSCFKDGHYIDKGQHCTCISLVGNLDGNLRPDGISSHPTRRVGDTSQLVYDKLNEEATPVAHTQAPDHKKRCAFKGELYFQVGQIDGGAEGPEARSILAPRRWTVKHGEGRRSPVLLGDLGPGFWGYPPNFFSKINF